MLTNRYYVTGIVKDCEESCYIDACSSKQAEFFFKRKYGFKMYNVIVSLVMGEDQLQFNI